MDHSAHHAMHNMEMDHSMPDMPDMPEMKCKMSMLLTTEYKDVCVITSKWHIATKLDMFFSILLVILLTFGYEWLKFYIFKWDQRYKGLISASPILTPASSKSPSVRSYKLRKSLLYGLSVFYSFLIMLIFMSFNLWLMVAVGVGAGLGKFYFDDSSLGSLACH